MLSLTQHLKTKSPGTLRGPWLTFSAIFWMAWLFLFEQDTFSLFVFDRDLVLRGEVWRVFTGHFVHCSFDHLFWDLAAFLIVGTYIEKQQPRQLIPALLFCCAVISFWLLTGISSISSYCGLSGALNGLVFIAIVRHWEATRDKICIAILLGTLAKILYELIFRQTVFANLSLQAVPEAHAVGFFAGILYLYGLRIGATLQAKL